MFALVIVVSTVTDVYLCHYTLHSGTQHTISLHTATERGKDDTNKQGDLDKANGTKSQIGIQNSKFSVFNKIGIVYFAINTITI